MKKGNLATQIITLIVSLACTVLLCYIEIVFFLMYALGTGLSGQEAVIAKIYCCIFLFLIILGLFSLVLSIVGIIVVAKKRFKSFIPLGILQIVSIMGLVGGIVLLATRKKFIEQEQNKI